MFFRACAAEAVFCYTAENSRHLTEGLSNIKKSAVSRGENISKKKGQKSYNYRETSKNYISLFGGKPARGLPTPATPHPTAQRNRTFNMRKMCECNVRTRFPLAGLGRGEWGGGKPETMPFINGSTHQLQT